MQDNDNKKDQVNEIEIEESFLAKWRAFFKKLLGLQNNQTVAVNAPAATAVPVNPPNTPIKPQTTSKFAKALAYSFIVGVSLLSVGLAGYLGSLIFIGLGISLAYLGYKIIQTTLTEKQERPKTQEPEVQSEADQENVETQIDEDLDYYLSEIETNENGKRKTYNFTLFQNYSSGSDSELDDDFNDQPKHSLSDDEDAPLEIDEICEDGSFKFKN